MKYGKWIMDLWKKGQRRNRKWGYWKMAKWKVY